MPEPTVSGRQFAFLLVDKFSMFSLAAAIDAFRSANRLLGRDFYGWTTVSADGEAVMASNGIPLKVDYGVGDIPQVDILFVAVGLSTEFPGKSKVLGALRNWGRRGGALGALSVGSYLLAEAGQLEGYRCTIHWENRAGRACAAPPAPWICPETPSSARRRRPGCRPAADRSPRSRS